MAKKIVSPLNVGDLVYVHTPKIKNQVLGHAGAMDNYKGLSFVVKAVGPNFVRFTFESIVSKGCQGDFVWDMRCIRRLRKAKNIVVKQAAAVKPVKLEEKKDDLLELRTVLKRKTDAEGVGLCSFAQMLEDGKKGYVVRGPCHAAVGRTYSINGADGTSKFKELILSIKGHIKQFPDDQQEDYKKYVDYLLNRSPWKIAFVPEPMDVRWELGARCNVNVPTEVLKAAAISLREMNEYKHRLPIFSRLVKDGCSENSAKLLSGCFLPTTTIDKYKFGGYSNGHQIWLPDFDAQDLFRFFKEGFPEETLKRKPFSVYGEGEYGIALSQAKASPKSSITNYVKNGLGINGAEPRWGEVNNTLIIPYDKLKEFAKHLDTVVN